MMRITLCGAAGEVTGSAYLVQTDHATVLVDLGLFQGRAADERRNADLRPIDPTRIDAIVLTHAHLDHTGRLPIAVARGFRGPIHCTPPTIDFTQLVLLDSAQIQQSEAQRRSRRLERLGREAIAPLYTQEDVNRLAGMYKPLAFHETRTIATGISVRLVNAGHMLGSGSIEMTVDDGGRRKVIVFSGDIGQKNWPILRDPETLASADLVFLESTYGDRDHRTLKETVDQFQQILTTALSAGEKVLIPSFAIGRAQQILWHIAELVHAGRLPPFPVYLDSPMALKANDIYFKHHGDMDAEAQRLNTGERFDLHMPLLTQVQTAEQSATLNNKHGAAVVIAGSGMCNAGRILHHLKHNLYRPQVAVLLVGFQAEGTLGRRLVDGAKLVRIHGQSVAVRAKVHTLGGFSGHAGKTGLLEWLEPLVHGKPKVALTHGEEPVRQRLAQTIRERLGLEVLCPMFNHVITL